MDAGLQELISNDTIRLFAPIFTVLILIVIGYLSKAVDILRSEDASILNKMIVYFFLPAFIFRAVKGADLSISIFNLALLAFIVTLLSLFIAYLVGKAINFEKGIFGVFLLAATVGNTGYLGFPLTQQLFGSENVVKAVFYDIFGTVLFIFTIGLYISETYGESEIKRSKLKEIISFPPLIAIVIGLLFQNIRFPELIRVMISFLAAPTIPLIMFSIGLSLKVSIKTKYIRPLIGVIIIKMIAAPAIAIFLGRMFISDPTGFRILVLEASMPIAMLTLILAIQYKLKEEFISTAIFLTTLISLITIPFWQEISKMVF